MAGRIWSLLGVSAPFDPALKFVTSPVFDPFVLALVRIVFAVYTFVTLLFLLIWEGVVVHDAQTFFSYFTYLTYTGLCAYFWASGVQTTLFAINSRNIKFQSENKKSTYPLQHWPRILQFLHSLLWTTITTFPFIVTPVFWGILAKPSTLGTPYNVWKNVSVHALNTVFALVEVFLTRGGPQPWLHVPFLILILGGYVGIAYITHATQGWYPYSFLNPQKEGPFLAAYLVGIPLAAVIIFSIVWAICLAKEHLLARRDQPVNGGKLEKMSDEVTV